MGTMLYSKGVYINTCFDGLNLSAPGLVKEVHAAYLAAGADILTTNSFGANRYHLREYGLEAKVAEVNRAAVSIAREVAGEVARGETLIAGDIGPISEGVSSSAGTVPQGSDLADAYAEQAGHLAEAGADFLLLESFRSLPEVLTAADAVLNLGLPVVVTLTLLEQDRLVSGESLGEAVRRLEERPLVGLGLSCCMGPEFVLEVAERLVELSSLPVFAQPNAGPARPHEGRQILLCTPEYLGTYAKFLYQKGVRVVGGCCGTTPQHIRAVSSSLLSLQPRMKAQASVGEDVKAVPLPPERRSRLGQELAAGRFVTSVEVTPPRGWDACKVVEKTLLLKNAGIGAINVPDGPRATARMNAMALAMLIEREVGLEAVLHVCCRDRNLIGLQSDLLGAAAFGLKNLLVITGDPPKLGDYPDATAVFDLDSVGLVRLANCLNQGVDLAGKPIGEPTSFLIGVGANPTALDLERELRHLDRKVEAGAAFAITQPVFDVSALERFVRRTEHLEIPIIAGIWPLVSLRNALFMQREVPGVNVPGEVVRRMAKAQDKSAEAALDEGMAIAREALARVRGLAQGVQVSASFGRVDLALKVIQP
ncbi:MAG: bifunctional homocysteine S-methyltransferase/methylenetetrahydrofolate reductase, partial [Pseudomonadota bacterium]